MFEASHHDWRVLVEQGIDAREIECAVLCPKAGEAPQASWPGEIVLDKRNSGDDQFYDFDSKYMDSSASHVEVPANLPQETLQQVRETAVKAFKAVDGAGLSRVDTFVTPDGEVMVNEINTMPGFTPISMYPKAWEATGIGYTDLITKLIDGVLDAFYRVRDLRGLQKKPSTSEVLDWIQALVIGGVPVEKLEKEIPFAGVLLKKTEDLKLVENNRYVY